MWMRKRLPINRWLLLSLAVILAGANVWGQDPSNKFETNGFPNGRSWEIDTPDEKLSYIQGFFNGLVVARSIEKQYVAQTSKQQNELVQHLVDQGLLIEIPRPEGEKPTETPVETIDNEFLLIDRFTLGDNIKELDKLYAERENILIPIPVAIRYCVLKLHGTATAAELEKYLIRLRKNASGPEEKKP